MRKALIDDKPTYKYYRCKDCNKLLTDGMISKGVCLGHRIRIADTCTFYEWILTKLGVIK